MKFAMKTPPHIPEDAQQGISTPPKKGSFDADQAYDDLVRSHTHRLAGPDLPGLCGDYSRSCEHQKFEGARLLRKDPDGSKSMKALREYFSQRSPT